MPPDLPYRLSLDDLSELYLGLKKRIERLDGQVQQLLAERAGHTIATPTWRDMETIKKDIARLEGAMSLPNDPKKHDAEGTSRSTHTRP